MIRFSQTRQERDPLLKEWILQHTQGWQKHETWRSCAAAAADFWLSFWWILTDSSVQNSFFILFFKVYEFPHVNGLLHVLLQKSACLHAQFSPA